MKEPRRISVRELRATLPTITKNEETVIVGSNYDTSAAFIPITVKLYASRKERAAAKRRVREAARALITSIG